MHNLISQNQLAEWKHIESDRLQETMTQIDDYYDCIIEADAVHGDKRMCSSLLP